MNGLRFSFALEKRTTCLSFRACFGITQLK
jgi:hypothetical protein